MKDFSKIVFGSALGFIIASIIVSILSMILFFGMIGSMASSFNKETNFNVENNSVLHLVLSGEITERSPADSPFSDMNMPGNTNSVTGMDDILSAIRKAKDDNKIKGIYIDSRAFSASYAVLDEIRKQLVDFKKSGKFIAAYSDTYTQQGYYLASVADKIALNPQGMLDLHGFAANTMFVKDALQKMGVQIQVFKVGTYKSAVEPLILNQMSDANREQTTSFITDIWKTVGNEIAQSRKISIQMLDSITNQSTLFKKPEFVLQNRLVDTLVYETEMKDYLRAKLNLKKDDQIPSATVKDMKGVTPAKLVKSKNKIALLYAEGDIVTGNGYNNIQDKYFVKQLEKLRKDDNVKAVVLRINSGGGSAYASEQIWKAVSDLKKVKPIVVSMGEMAASGGYYISCNATRIIAQPTTLTGSIGIFGIVPNFEGTTKKLGVQFDVTKTHQYADFGSLNRPMNEGEKQMMQTYVNDGYSLFVKRCADGRKLPVEQIQKIAEGRVWTGNQAKQIGLVDEIGGLKDAIKVAGKLAKLNEDYIIKTYPEKRTFFEELFQKESKVELAAKTIKEYLGDDYEIFNLVKSLREQDFVQAKNPYKLVLR